MTVIVIKKASDTQKNKNWVPLLKARVKQVISIHVSRPTLHQYWVPGYINIECQAIPILGAKARQN